MPEVVAESRQSNVPHFMVGDVHIRLLLLEYLHLLPSQVACADAVLKSSVSCGGKHLVGQTELLQVLQALELGCVHE